ncbi:hypothetical protein [Lutimonas sp.]|uniref:hypothetical protein n=1 Tax=Lutimonas sp. TaxID=1872403 RepID=UPI003D9BA796
MKHVKYRDKLQNKRIKPSSGSWDILEKALDTQEKKERKRRWPFLKIASIVLIVISVSYFSLSPEKKIDKTPVKTSPKMEVASPAVKKDKITPNEENQVISADIANPVKTSPITDPASDDPVIIASKDNSAPLVVPDENLIEVSINDSITGVIQVAEMPKSEEELIDEEVDQLLRNSKIKLVVNGQISSEKVVSSEALLNSVEEDLYKDLKQKLIEKITNKLKNPKEIVTSRDN